jgi:hypothetical protein
MGILTADEMIGDDPDEKAAMETLELIADGVYNVDRPSNLVLRELVQVIRLIEERQNILGT